MKLLVLLLILTVIFGPTQLPRLIRVMGKLIREKGKKSSAEK